MAQIERARPGTASLRARRQDPSPGRRDLRPANVGCSVLERLSRLAGDESKHYEDVTPRSCRRTAIGTASSRARRSKVITSPTHRACREYRRSPPAAPRHAAFHPHRRVGGGWHPREHERPVGSDSATVALNAPRYEAVNGGVLTSANRSRLRVPMLLGLRHEHGRGLARERPADAGWAADLLDGL